MNKYVVQKSLSKNIINTTQIKALLWKDFLVRIRQPWITLIQYVWPLFLFMAIYFFRLKYVSISVADSPHCKLLYEKVTSSIEGKMLWSLIRPVIQGKLVYGPDNSLTNEIMAKVAYQDDYVKQFQRFLGALNQILILLRTDTEFQSNVKSFLELARSPFIQMIVGNSVDIDMAEEVIRFLSLDDKVSTAVQMAVNFSECYATDRLVKVTTEEEMERMAHELNEKKIFLGCVYFYNVSSTTDREYSYKIRMDLDNVPISMQSRNRFHLPVPHPDFERDIKYQRGFIQLQHKVDQAIIETIRQHETRRLNAEQTKLLQINYENIMKTSVEPDGLKEGAVGLENTTMLPARIESNNNAITDIVTSVAIISEETTDALDNTTALPPRMAETESKNNETSEAISSHFKDDNSTVRQRRATPDLFEFDFDQLFKPLRQTLRVDQLEIYAKQFPHPKHKEDRFVYGVYLTQVIQFGFVLGLSIQLAVSVWQRIWTKESGNSTLMRIMGLRKSSELLAWIIISIVELLIIFAICIIVLYMAEVIIVTSAAFLFFFIILFAICMTSFCYMLSTFFSTAAVGTGLCLSLIQFIFLPYIVIVTHDTELNFASKFFANLSVVTAFCSAWRNILLYEVLQKDLSFDNAFDSTCVNDLKFNIFMLMFDTVLYSIVGYLYERFMDSDYKFYNVPVKRMDIGIGGLMENVTKTFDGGKIPAVNDVSIVFRRNHVTCLLGHNGAGKTTIIKLLTGQLKQTSGEIYLTYHFDRTEYRQTIGLCPQNNVFIPNLTAKEHLELYACIKSPDRHSAALDEAMKGLDFGEHLNFKCENLSGGFKRRLNIALAFIGSPSLVILDEPCTGVDDTGRKRIWRLIADLRKGRAVILATHFLDEAERLGDNVLFLRDGEVISQITSEAMKNQFTKSFDIQIKLEAESPNRRKIVDEIRSNLETYTSGFSVTHPSDDEFHINIRYCDSNDKYIDFEPLIKFIEKQQQQGTILNFRVIGKDLAEMFRNQSARNRLEPVTSDDRDYNTALNFDQTEEPAPPPATASDQLNYAKYLFWKRFVHFKRNFGFILLLLVIPPTFKFLALTCMTYRTPREFDSELVFSPQLYANSTHFYAHEQVTNIDNKTLTLLQCHNQCEYFSSSQQAFNWILGTHNEFIGRRYSGITINNSKLIVWYNSKGYHALPVYLNELNSALFKSEMDNDLYKITTSCQPLKLKGRDLSLLSILEQLGDTGLAIVLIISFSFVLTAQSVYLVTERVSGEKQQQRLCNVKHVTYWGVAFVWDLSIYCMALLITLGLFKLYDIPVFTARDNLYGLGLLTFVYGVSMILLVHLTEKLFYDANMAAMYMTCLNIVFSLAPTIVLLLFDFVLESERSRTVRKFLRFMFLVLPQHAFADGLIEIAKNHVTAGTFTRFDLYNYNSPISSTLLLPHILSSLILALLYMILNYLVENGHMHRFRQRIRECRITLDDNNVLLTSVSNDQTTTGDKYDVRTRGNILVVEKLRKAYGDHQVLDNVSFNVAASECFGLLGVNGAGKSTIFSILSGESYQSSGYVRLLDKKGISYCPQTNALDELLTVEEVIRFYGRLRKIANIEHLITRSLKSFELEQYRNVLVKTLSGGNRRKVSVAIACFGDTRLVLMDEPTSDMDPVTRTLVYKAIVSLVAAKRSVILTSHTISEIEQVCHRIGVMRAGKMFAIDSPMALKRRFGQSYVVKVYYDPAEAATMERHVLNNFPGVENLTKHNNSCLQFIIKVRSSESDNSIDANSSTRILLSNLVGKLYKFTQELKVSYTISECLLDQVIQQVHESNVSHAYCNPGFTEDETQFI